MMGKAPGAVFSGMGMTSFKDDVSTTKGHACYVQLETIGGAIVTYVCIINMLKTGQQTHHSCEHYAPIRLHAPQFLRHFAFFLLLLLLFYAPSYSEYEVGVKYKVAVYSATDNAFKIAASAGVIANANVDRPKSKETKQDWTGVATASTDFIAFCGSYQVLCCMCCEWQCL